MACSYGGGSRVLASASFVRLSGVLFYAGVGRGHWQLGLLIVAGCVAPLEFMAAVFGRLL